MSPPLTQPPPFGLGPSSGSHLLPADPLTARGMGSRGPLGSNQHLLANTQHRLGGVPPMSTPLPSRFPTAGHPIVPSPAVYTLPTKPGATALYPAHDNAFQRSWLVRLWNRRHQCAAMVVSLVFFMGGLSVALVLFFWFRGVHRSYYSNNLQRTCLSLGDSLALDIATNLVTYADDLAGYVATEPNLSNAAVTKFTSLATNHSEETDGISLVPVLPRHRKPEWEQQFNLTLIDGNDTFTRLSLVAPITLRVQFTPSRTPMKNPIGYNMFQAGEYARSVRRTLGNGRPSLVVAEPGSTQLHPPHKRVWIAKGVQQVPVPNFHIWIMTLLVDTQRAVSRTLAPSDRTHGIRVKLVDNTTTSELYVSQFPPNSTLIPSDTTLTSFPVVDRNWTLTCTGTHTLRGAFYTPWSWVLLFLLISVFTVSAEIARRAAVRFLAARGVARQVKHREGLVASLRMYSRAIVSTVRDPLIALDPFGYLVGSNKEALARLDIHGPDTSSVHISSLLPPEFVANVMNTPHQLPVASPAVPPMVDQDWDSVYTVTGGAASDPLPLLEPLPPGSYEVGPVGTQSAKFIAEATVSQPTAAKRGEVSQVLLLHDVTERIQALESLQAAREAAKAASVAKSQLLLLISHELRNPIYVISTLVEEIAAVAATADPLAPASGDSIGMRPARTDDSEYIAAARVQHTTRLIADILGFLVDLFADTTALEAARLAATVSGGPKTARAKGPGKHLISLANAALASVHPQLDLWDITVERWISPEWVLHGPTVTVERILAKVAYIVAHATRPYGQAVLELLVDLRNRELRVYCRGDMWIPTENSLQPMASIPPQSPLATSLAPSVQQEKPVMWHEDKIAVPEHIDPLTHAALFLAMGSVCAIVLPMNGSAFRTQFSEQYGGLDMSIPLGLMRAKRVKCTEASGEDTQAVVPVPAAATAPFSEELVSLASISSLAMGTPARPSLPFDGPQRNLAPSSDAYPSPISPDRVTLPLPKMTVPQVVPIDSIAVHPKRYDENHRKELFTPCHSRTNSFSNPASFPQSPSSAPRTPRTAYSPCPPPNSRRESRMTSLMAVRTMTPHSPSPPASVGVAPPAPSSSASNESPSSDLSHASPLDFQPLIPSNDTLPLHIPLPSSPAPSAKSLKLSVPAALSPRSAPRLTLARVPTPVATPTPATLDVFPSFPATSSILFPTPTSQVISTTLHNPSPPNLLPISISGTPVQKPPVAAPVASVQPTNHRPSAGPKRILVVEDNTLVLRVTCKLVKTLGYEADTAMDGLECVKRMNDESKPKVDLILMDLVMPNMSGMDAMKTLRDAGYSKDALPIVAVTANALPEEREACMEAGFNEFVTKPLKKDGLVDICKRFIFEVVD